MVDRDDEATYEASMFKTISELHLMRLEGGHLEGDLLNCSKETLMAEVEVPISYSYVFGFEICTLDNAGLLQLQ